MLQIKRFSSIEDFYSANEERRRSGEADYGVWWTEPGVVGYWRVSYVQATGEVYATLLRSRGQDGRVEILGVVPPDQETGLARGKRYYRTLDSILEGWAEHCMTTASLPWVRDKLRFFIVN